MEEVVAVATGRGRKRARRRGNYYLSKLMTSADRAELRRAAQVQGLEDEIAMIRVWLKKEMLKENPDLELMSLALDRLSRAIGIQHKVAPKKVSDEWLDNMERVLRRFPEVHPPEGWPYGPADAG